LANILGEDVVQTPTTMPWGNRSLLFRDPDGSLVNFFTPMTQEAKGRFETTWLSNPLLIISKKRQPG
jgi:hypothetical protein